MSLYLKYRPQTFENLVGQDHVRTIIKNAIDKDLVAHAYLFCGPRGTGKTSTARLVAKALNCENLGKNFEPCNECAVCKSINESALIDVIEIDAASNRGIDEIRELRETIKFAPSIAKNKVYIIDEVHMLTNEAFNALLKTLEEPPANVFFILATTEVHKIPSTVMSRCQRFDFKRLDRDVMFGRLKEIADKEKIEYDEAALKMIAEHVDGGLRDAIGLMDQLSVSGKITVDVTKNLIGSTGTETLSKFLESILAKDESSALAVVEELYNEGYELKQFMQDLMKLIREEMHAAINSTNQNKKMQLMDLITHLTDVMETFRNPIIPQLPLEVLVIKYCNQGFAAPVATPAVIPAANSKPKLVQDKPKTIEPPVQKPAIETGLTEVPIEKPAEIVAEKDAVIETPKVDTPPTGDAINITVSMWEKLLTKINKPTLRRSLEQGKFSGANDGTLELAFTSMFHYNAVNTAEHLKIVEDFLREMSHQKAQLVLTKVDAPAEPPAAKIEPQKAPAAPVQTMAADDLADFFGGEIV